MLAMLLCACVTETTNKVFNVEPSDEKALADYLQLALSYLDQGDLPNAKRHLNNAAKLDAYNSEMLSIWGIIYAREGEFDLAYDNFYRSLKLDGNNSKSRDNYAAFLFTRNDYEGAIEQLSYVVTDTEYPKRPQAFENLGVAALQIGRTEEAEQAFSRALQLDANQLHSALELANINLNRNDVLQARAYWRNYQRLTQFYNIEHNAQSLLLGARLEAAMQNEENALLYGELLRTNFPASPEYQQYGQLMDD